jgi:DNA recombination protein RmuC
MMTPLIISVLSFLFGALVVFFYRKLVIERGMVPAKELEALKLVHQQALLQYTGQVATLQSELGHREEKLQRQKEEMEHTSQKLEQQFKLLAHTVLEEKSEKFSVQQEQNLKTILDPLKEQIRTFREEYEVKRSKESEERISLREQVKQMMELNKGLSEQANNLTNALRGNVKQQGNWGEMILESMLQYAGLEKDIHYFVQQQSRNDAGQLIQPDIVVQYPDSRAVVIDAKVSLLHYESYCASTTQDEQAIAVNSLLRSFKNHIDGLSSKSYQDINNALDFVMMFVPVEAAYITAMQSDTALWQYAYSKKILLISPANLIAAMKLIADMWQRDNINKEAHHLATRAGKLYDKLVLFVENFDKVGLQLQKAQDCWQEAQKQLVKGRGNAIAQAEQMKGYQAKTSKTLPPKLVEEAMLEDGMAVEEG